MAEGRIRVVIDDRKRIPFIGKGPVRNPIYITLSQFETLKKLGFSVREVDDLAKKPVSESPAQNKNDEQGSNTQVETEDTTTKVDDTTEDTSGADEALEEESTEEEETEETVDEEESEDTEEELEDAPEDIEEDEGETASEDESEETEEESEEESEDDEESEDEETEDEEEEEDEEEYIDVEKMTKKEIQEKLDELGVKYNKNSNLTSLKNLLLENLEEDEDEEE